jgi:hypothetical protein
LARSVWVDDAEFEVEFQIAYGPVAGRAKGELLAIGDDLESGDVGEILLHDPYFLSPWPTPSHSLGGML